MSVDKKTVQKIASLARINVGEDELAPVTDKMNGMQHCRTNRTYAYKVEVRNLPIDQAK